MRSAILDKQWALFDEGQYDEAFERTRAMLERLPPADRRAAWRLMGMARHAGRQYEDAVKWLHELCVGSDVADDWCRLALASTMAGQFESAATAFEQARFCHQASRHSQHPGLYLHIFWYAGALCDMGRYADVRPLLDELAQAYRRLHQTDGVFLFAQDMPFLASVLSLALQCFRREGSYVAGVTWLETLLKGLDAAGQRQVGLALNDLVQKDGTREHEG